MEIVRKSVGFMKYDIWRIPSSSLTLVRRTAINLLRILILTVRGFDEDRCKSMAAALTFLSLLSIIPLAAMGFGIAKGFGFEKVLENEIYQRLHGHEEVAEKIIEFSASFLEHARGGMIAGIGFMLLLWIIISMLGNIENSFNAIWGVKQNRRFTTKFSDYLSVTVITLVLFILSSTIGVFLSGWADGLRGRMAAEIISPLLVFFLRFLPFLFICAMFTFIYVFMPNTKVKFKSGLLAGVIAGILFQTIQILYIRLQVHLTGYGAIYGSFAAVPLFLIWLRISWITTLFGAELSFAHQNVNTYEFEPDCLRISGRVKTLLLLRTAKLFAKNFAAGGPPLSAEQVSTRLEVPIRLVNLLLYDLANAGILMELRCADDKSTVYQPVAALGDMTVNEVMGSIEKSGIKHPAFGKILEEDLISKAVEEFDSLAANSPANLKLKDA